jgi:uncharacterized protein (TIGR00369 family)
MSLILNATEVMAYLTEVFPQMSDEFAIDELTRDTIAMRLLTAERHLRPGGTVSGPSMFALADCAVYALVLGRVGRKALAVTTSCSMDFMRKPAAGVDLLAQGRLLKLGKLLVVADVLMFSQGVPAPVARASMTYAIPPDRD